MADDNGASPESEIAGAVARANPTDSDLGS
jgi:hypothetical protein